MKLERMETEKELDLSIGMVHKEGPLAAIAPNAETTTLGCPSRKEL